ncbi:MAG: helix-hairpin-helix domain-containing protein, partial [Bacteroidota bacterium]
MRQILLIFLFLFSGFIPKVSAQQYPRQNIDFQAFVQNIIGIPTESLNYDELLESLSQFYINPLDLNKANFAQLASLYVLSDSQINSLLDYRTKAGSFASIYELQAVPSFDLNTIYKIIPFVTISESELSMYSIGNSFNKANHTLILRTNSVLEQKKGYTPLQGRETVRYLGTPGSV